MRVGRRFIPVLLSAGVALNVLGGLAVDFLKLPIFLDTAGTMLVAVVAGPWWGALTGGLSNLLLSFWIPDDLWFGLANASVGITVGYIVRARGFKDYLTPLISGLTAGVIASLVGTLVASFVFGEVAGDTTGVIAAGLGSFSDRVLTPSLVPVLLTNAIDKLISVYLVFYLTRALPFLAPEPPEGFVDPVLDQES